MNLDTNTLNIILAFSFAFLAMSATLLSGAVIQLLWKGRDTLDAVERLCNTVNDEVSPTAVQLREVMDGLNQLRGTTVQRITAVAHKAEDVAGSVGTVVEKAQKQSAVVGTGLLAGFRTYLFGDKQERTAADKQITMDRGERHELKQ